MTDVKIDIKEDITWTSCLCDRSTDSRLLKYSSTMFVILIVICFCIYQLIHADTCESTTTYISLLTLVLGVVFPAPSFK